jgi:tetratricopeptide (TPR) repeat protein
MDANTGYNDYQLAAVLYTQKRYSQSLAILDELVKSYPDHIKIRLGRARCLFHLEQYRECLEICEELLAISDDTKAMELKDKILALVPELAPQNTGQSLIHANVDDDSSGAEPTLEWPEPVATFDSIPENQTPVEYSNFIAELLDDNPCAAPTDALKPQHGEPETHAADLGPIMEETPPRKESIEFFFETSEPVKEDTLERTGKTPQEGNLSWLFDNLDSNEAADDKPERSDCSIQYLKPSNALAAGEVATPDQDMPLSQIQDELEQKKSFETLEPAKSSHESDGAIEDSCIKAKEQEVMDHADEAIMDMAGQIDAPDLDIESISTLEDELLADTSSPENIDTFPTGQYPLPKIETPWPVDMTEDIPQEREPMESASLPPEPDKMVLPTSKPYNPIQDTPVQVKPAEDAFPVKEQDVAKPAVVASPLSTAGDTTQAPSPKRSRPVQVKGPRYLPLLAAGLIIMAAVGGITYLAKNDVSVSTSTSQDTYVPPKQDMPSLAEPQESVPVDRGMAETEPGMTSGNPQPILRKTETPEDAKLVEVLHPASSAITAADHPHVEQQELSEAGISEITKALPVEKQPASPSPSAIENKDNLETPPTAPAESEGTTDISPSASTALPFLFSGMHRSGARTISVIGESPVSLSLGVSGSAPASIGFADRKTTTKAIRQLRLKKGELFVWITLQKQSDKEETLSLESCHLAAGEQKWEPLAYTFDLKQQSPFQALKMPSQDNTSAASSVSQIGVPAETALIYLLFKVPDTGTECAFVLGGEQAPLNIWASRPPMAKPPASTAK